MTIVFSSLVAVKVATLVLLTAVFVADQWTPLGFAHGMLYMPVIVLALFTGSRRWVWSVGLAGGFLILSGVWLVDTQVVKPSVYWSNRLVSTGLLIVVLFFLDRSLVLLLSRRLSIRRLNRAQDELIGYRQLRRNADYRHRLFTELTDTLPVIIWMADEAGNVDFMNQAVADYTGVAIADIPLPMGWLDLLHPDDRAEAVSDWQSAIARQQPYTTEFRLRRQDGHFGVFLVTAKPVNHPVDGSRWYGTATNLDEHRKLQAQLYQAQRLESIGRLTGGLAHDFNNILSVITGNAGLLREILADHPKHQALANTIEQAANNGAQLTKTLLAFARRQPLTPSVFNVVDVVRELDPIIKNAVGEGVDYRRACEGNVWPVRLDRAQFESALLNLAINARDAMPDGGVLTISCSNLGVDRESLAVDESLPKGDWVMVHVEDTGVGMDVATLSRAYEPFFSTKEVSRGTGLGLSQVFGYITQSGGVVRTESTPDTGTKVCLYLPALVNQGNDDAGTQTRQ
jgi:PAS domain S-box-containing protein